MSESPAKLSECDSTQPTGNLKCVIISALLASGYWFLPSKNKWVLAFI